MTRDQELATERKVQNDDINRMIKAGEPLFSVILKKYDWNALGRAIYNPDKRKQKRERRESHEDM